ncbi:hypothetical protein G9A89_020044 [Geosiphon pyriformis]|nr:hypothetical protein G9A89_020044 [Geosiphon pyriformis]
MIITRAKNKKAASNICPEISNKISTRKAFSVVEATRQNILEAFLLPSNCDKLSLVAIKAIFLSLTGFLPVKVPLKRHIWISFSVVSTPTKNPKVFNNRLINKLVFLSIDSTSGAASIISSKKWSKKPKVQKTSFNTLSKIGLDQPLAVLPNMMFFSRSLLILEAKQFPSVELPVLKNWANQMKTESFSPLVFGVTFSGAWETIINCQRFTGWVAFTLVFGATFKIKLAHVKTVFQLVHGFLDVKSVLKDNVKLFCVEFASQVSLKAVFLVELTSSVHLATLKIAKSLVIFEFGSLSAAVVLHDVPLGVFAINIKMALNVFNSVTYVVLKPVGIWQYVVVYFEKLDSALSALVESIVKPIGSLVTTFEQFINGDLVSSSALGLKINKVLMHISSFSRTVGKLEKEVVFLKKECCIKNIDISGNSELPLVMGNKMFSNLMSF